MTGGAAASARCRVGGVNRRPNHARLIPRTAEYGATTPHLGLDADELTRVRAGAYVRTEEWDELFAEGRLRTLAAAVDSRNRTTGAAYSHATAAAVHGWPAYRVRSDRVEMIVPGAHTRKNSKDVIRHHAPLPPGDVVLVDGLRVTSLDRTVYDAIRSETLEAAVACFDAALRSVAWNDDACRYDEDAAEEFRECVRRRIRQNPGARGIRQARLVIELTDGRAQLPGESISRLWMLQLGVPEPILQHRVDLPGGFAQLDFAWPRLRRWAEFDGKIKYFDPAYTGGRTADQVLFDQRVRQRDVTAATGWRVDRWGFDELSSIGVFAAHLRAIGLLPG